MSFLVRAFPLRESVADFEAFVSAMQGPRHAEASAFYQHFGIDHESWHLQHTEHGPWVIVVTLVRDVADSSQKYAQASDEFTCWFRGQVLALSGVDPTVDPLGPPTSEVYHWSATPQLARTFAV